MFDSTTPDSNASSGLKELKAELTAFQAQVEAQQNELAQLKQAIQSAQSQASAQPQNGK